jgi:hypothetical protein
LKTGRASEANPTVLDVVGGIKPDVDIGGCDGEAGTDVLASPTLLLQETNC